MAGWQDGRMRQDIQDGKWWRLTGPWAYGWNVWTAGCSRTKSQAMEYRELTERIIGCAMKVHTQLGAGFLESVYQNALVHELRKADVQLEAERRVSVKYDGIVVGEFVADLLVEDAIIVELKALNALLPVHEAQLVN